MSPVCPQTISCALMMVVDGVDFLWATPSRHTSTPELVIEDFLRNSGVTIDKIRCDDATVSRSETFKLLGSCCTLTVSASASLVTSIPSAATSSGTWTTGADVPVDAALHILSDKQLGRALAHHKLILHLPIDWWINP
mmetsp:Transcript_61453/g.126937  ORF Transcript_61453/g.126937 Transcript_61453/m.126937 type:complete len:138 (-) Transcript_61453:92-505(-)